MYAGSGSTFDEVKINYCKEITVPLDAPLLFEMAIKSQGRNCTRLASQNTFNTQRYSEHVSWFGVCFRLTHFPSQQI
jgi:hypothetical protein